MLEKLVFNYTKDDLIEMARADAFKKGQEMVGRNRGEKLTCKELPTVMEDEVEIILEFTD
jgi:hypothetical protein